MAYAKNLVLTSCLETSRSTFPLYASIMIGITGRTTMNIMQISIDVEGISIGPSLLEEAIDMIAPATRLIIGAGVTLEMARAKVTFLPDKSSDSSPYFTLVQLPFGCKYGFEASIYHF